MAQLNQIVAVEKGVKSRTNRELSELYKDLQKNVPMSGITRTYRPKNEDGDQLPSETTRVQFSVDDLTTKLASTLGNLVNVTFTKELGNTEAKADVVVEGNVILESVPVGMLLFLEKMLQDVHTFVTHIPVLDAAESWSYDSSTNTYKSATVDTARTKKVPRNHVKAEATDRHPAQVEMYYEDVVVGFWSTTKFSGALPQETKDRYLKNVTALRDAVKYAREQANALPVEDQHIAGDSVFDFIFG
jgi:predicted transcriptional regulator